MVKRLMHGGMVLLIRAIPRITPVFNQQTHQVSRNFLIIMVIRVLHGMKVSLMMQHIMCGEDLEQVFIQKLHQIRQVPHILITPYQLPCLEISADTKSKENGMGKRHPDIPM